MKRIFAILIILTNFHNILDAVVKKPEEPPTKKTTTPQQINRRPQSMKVSSSWPPASNDNSESPPTFAKRRQTVARNLSNRSSITRSVHGKEEEAGAGYPQTMRASSDSSLPLSRKKSTLSLNLSKAFKPKKNNKGKEEENPFNTIKLKDDRRRTAHSLEDIYIREEKIKTELAQLKEQKNDQEEELDEITKTLALKERHRRKESSRSPSDRNGT